MLPEQTEELVGSMLDADYRVIEPIGAGGMAAVYLVEHQTLHKRFAAKVLSHALASSPEARVRFTQAAHAASQLDHENIVSISDFGVTADQRPFFVMELLLGQTLDQRLAERPMTIEEVVAVGFPAARALAHAHAHGIVHCDVKPENIFLVQSSQGYWGVKLVDFGLARPALDASPAQPGAPLVTSEFMAPEMCRGEAVDLRADIYSFGILLHLMICGRLPFVDGQLRVLQMQLVELPARPRAINTELSPELAVVVERALAKRPNDRYPSMDALLRDLTAALPMGSDRLLRLIEGQSGPALREASLAGAPLIAHHEAHRASQPMPIASASQPFIAPSSSQPFIAPSSSQPFIAPSSSQPFPMAALRPPAPQRRRAPIVFATAIASTIVGALVLRQLTTAPTASARAHEVSAPDNPTVVAAVPHAEVAPAAPKSQVAQPPPAAPASDDRAGAPAAAGERDPAPDGVASPPEVAPEPADAAPKVESSTAKKALLRPRPVTRREPTRPGKRVAVLDPGLQRSMDRPVPAVSSGPADNPMTVTGKVPLAGSSTAPSAKLPAGTPLQGSQAMGAEAGSGALPADGGRSGHPEAGGARNTTAGSPPVVEAPAKPAAPAGPGALDATPEVVSLDVKGSLSPSIVRRSVDRTLSALRTCYRTAARAGGATPAVDLRLTFEIDENSLATQVATSGANFGSLASCAAGVASQIRTQEAPDVGTVQVAVVIRFRPS